MALQRKTLRRTAEVVAIVAIIAVFVAGIGFEVTTVHGSGTGGGTGGGYGFPTLPSKHWAGFVANGPSADKSVFARVTLPGVTCDSKSDVGALAIWVGYGGNVTGDPDVVQDGVRADCTRIRGKLTPNYWLWWELFPANKPDPGNSQLQALSKTLQAGYIVDMYVDAPLLACDLYLRNGRCIHWTQGAYFSLTVLDANGAYVGSWSETVAFPPHYSPKLASSECIGEDPYNGGYSAPLPLFSPVQFKGCSVFGSGNPVNGLYIQRSGTVLVDADLFSYTTTNNTLFAVIQRNVIPSF